VGDESQPGPQRPAAAEARCSIPADDGCPDRPYERTFVRHFAAISSARPCGCAADTRCATAISPFQSTAPARSRSSAGQGSRAQQHASRIAAGYRNDAGPQDRLACVSAGRRTPRPASSGASVRDSVQTTRTGGVSRQPEIGAQVDDFRARPQAVLRAAKSRRHAGSQRHLRRSVRRDAAGSTTSARPRGRDSDSEKPGKPGWPASPREVIATSVRTRRMMCQQTQQLRAR